MPDRDGESRRSSGTRPLGSCCWLPTLARKTSVTAALFALIVSLMVLTRAPAMELNIVGNQLILSGPVVGDEPGKCREALASSPGIETVILHNSIRGTA